ncbi:MAG: hypothetical protein WD825_03150 [Gemmatimonadaceae bacterium]
MLDFCAPEAPIFFAIQNEGEDWQRVTGLASHTFAFEATPRVAIAMTFDRGSSVLTDVYYTTSEELLPLSGISCTEVVGTKTVHGTVSNVPSGGRAVVSMSGAAAEVISPATNFTLVGVADSPQDVVAHRDGNALNIDVVPDRVIVRRAQNPIEGATLSDLNFGTQSSAAVATNPLTIGGMSAGDDSFFDVIFGTALGTTHTLYQSPIFSGSSRVLYSIPSTLTQSGDLHEILLNSDSPNASAYRTVRHWYRNPATKNLSFGAALVAPSISSVATSPYARMRALLPAQVDYSRFATAFFIQDTRSMFVTVTAGHTEGTPGTWTLEVPDLTAAGIPSTAGLEPGQSTTTTVEAYDGALSSIFGGGLTDGAIMRFAGRSSITSTVQLRQTAVSRPGGPGGPGGPERAPISTRRGSTR